MNDSVIEQTVEGILARKRAFLTQMLTRAAAVGTPAELGGLERAFREGSMEQSRLAYQDVLSAAAQSGDGGRQCPHCHARRRHKGRRPRKVLTSVGYVAVDGVCWQCDTDAGGCGRHEHASARLGLDGSVTTTAPMRELICLLGLTQSSFANAGTALAKLMAVKLSTPTIASVCEEEGRRIEAADTDPAGPVRGTLVGSCDGTMVHIREDGWRELRAWRFDDDTGRRRSGAALEKAEQFVPRLREEALRQHADQVKRFVFVSDAAEWIKQGVAEFLPEADTHIIDIYHAYQHVHEAARTIYGEGSDSGRWAKQWCEELELRGGQAVHDRLRHARFDTPQRQAALDKLLAYLRRHGPHLDYPRFRQEGLPISSGPMESTCKQLGHRLKGPGMRWRHDNVSPMATLISLWNDKRWDNYWLTPAA